jgi:hypothetical protein
MFTSTTSLSPSPASLSHSLSPPPSVPVHNNSEYESIFVNQRIKWRVKGNSLRCVSSGVFVEATVLAEELAYNRSLRQYKMFILERPLDPNFKVHVYSTQCYVYNTCALRHDFPLDLG